MKKSELRTGMMIETNEGELYLTHIGGCFGDLGIGVSGRSSFDLNLLSDPLSDDPLSDDTVVLIENIYQPLYPNLSLSLSDYTNIWSRKEGVKEYTIEELIKKVGHEFKIKK